LQDFYTPRESLSNKKIAQCDFSFTRLILRGFRAQHSGYSYPAMAFSIWTANRASLASASV
jgi:hypothetical protein